MRSWLMRGLGVVAMVSAICYQLFAISHEPAAHAQTGPGPLLPIGGGYSDIYAGFSAAAVASARDGEVVIGVLPTAYSTNPVAITDAERAANMRDAEERRFQIEEACKRAAPAGLTCRAVLAPIFTRDDAADPEKLSTLKEPLAAVFILGGDQTIAMQALIDTPAERALAEAHANGTVVAGTSAGGGMLAATMLGGYNPNFAAANSLDFGAADVWNTPERRGLPFGVQNAILDQHFFQRGRLGRLLNAIALPGVPHVGVGVDAYTGVSVVGDRLEGVFGLYDVAVLDAETYHAADGVRYVGPRSTVSLRNVLVHLLAPGDAAWYDLAARRHALAAPPPTVERTFDALTLPPGAGTLILAGDLSQGLAAAAGGGAILERFYQRAGGPDARLLIVADGYASARSARTAAEAYAAALAAPAEIVVASEAEGALSLQGITGVVLVGRDQSKLDPARLGWLAAAWEAGMPVLADNALAPLLGAFYSAHGPTPKDAEQAEIATQKSFRQGGTQIAPGLGLLDITVEPQLLNDNRWGRLFSLAHAHPDRLAIGLTRDTGLEIGPGGATVIGANVVLLLDLRQAALSAGENGGFVIANGLLDVFGPGEAVRAAMADVNARLAPPPTPVLRAAQPTVTSTATPVPPPTVTPTLTATPDPTPTAAPSPKPTSPVLPTPTPSPPPGGRATAVRLGGLGLVLAVLLAVLAGIGRLRRRGDTPG
jgi:cyanophycinase